MPASYSRTHSATQKHLMLQSTKQKVHSCATFQSTLTILITHMMNNQHSMPCGEVALCLIINNCAPAQVDMTHLHVLIAQGSGGIGR